MLLCLTVSIFMKDVRNDADEYISEDLSTHKGQTINDIAVDQRICDNW